ncbi:hypothetical protein ACFROC_29205 [Nocardia tengchongensis]|uniref:hypothetical protein n=1 Tax=Nocardia tengchongensis TaxID=2055889 RepID=UPI00368AD752
MTATRAAARTATTTASAIALALGVTALTLGVHLPIMLTTLGLILVWLVAFAVDRQI